MRPTIVLACLICVSFFVSLSAHADATPPAEVREGAAGKDQQDIVLTWDPVTSNFAGGAEDVAEYRVYRGIVPAFVPDLTGGLNRIGVTANPEFRDIDAFGHVDDLYYLVTAVDTAGNEGSPRKSQITDAPTLDLAMTMAGADLSWADADPAGAVAGYVVYWGTIPFEYGQSTDVGLTNSTMVAGLNPGVVYYFAVVGYDDDSVPGPVSNEKSDSLIGSQGPTEVSGRIEIDTTWGPDGSPYIVTGDILIYGDDDPFRGPAVTPVLTIEPGVVVKFNAGTGIIVGQGAASGALDAQGQPSNPVRFTANLDVPSRGYWKGIDFTDATGDTTSHLVDAEIEFGGQVGGAAITVSAASPEIRNIQVREGAGDGVHLLDGAAVTILSSAILGHDGVAALVRDASPSIVSSTLRPGSGSVGLYLDQATAVTGPSIQSCDIELGVTMTRTAIDPTISGNTFESFSTAQLGAEDVSAFVADNTLEDVSPSARIVVLGEVLQTDAIWPNTGIPYEIAGNVFVDGTTASLRSLTIAPGARLEFDTNTKIEIGDQSRPGQLLAQGTAIEPIVFSSVNATPAPGDWSGIEFSTGTVETSELSHAVIEFAGLTQAIRVDSVGVALRHLQIRDSGGRGVRGVNGASPTIEDSVFRRNGSRDIELAGVNDAIVLRNDLESGVLFDLAGNHRVEDNTFRDYGANGLMLRVGPNAMPSLDSNTFEMPSADAIVELIGGTIAQSVAWPDIGLPCELLTSLTIGEDGADPVALTLTAGSVFRSVAGAEWLVGGAIARGALIAQGTPSNPITFTSSVAGPGNWRGLYVRAGSQSDTILEHVVVENAGATRQANVLVDGSSPTIRNATVRNSSVYGIRILNDGAPTVESVIFDTNASYDIYTPGSTEASVVSCSFGSAAYFPVDASYSLQGNTFRNYGTSGLMLRIGAQAMPTLGLNAFVSPAVDALVELVGGTIDQDAAWPNVGLPYQVLDDITIESGTPALATLTLAPGSEFRAIAGTEWLIGGTTARGALVAQGTAPQPIVFTSSVSGPGNWRGLYVRPGSLSDTILDQVIVENAGATRNANILADGSHPSVSNATIRASSAHGVRGINDASPVLDTVTFENNADHDVHLDGDSDAEIRNSQFEKAIYFNVGTGSPVIQDNVFTDYAGEFMLRLPPAALTDFTGNTFAGTDATSLIRVIGGTLDESRAHVWRKLIVPYELVTADLTIAGTYTTPASLTIEPGVTLRLQTDRSLVVASSNQQGTLIAQGIAGEEILFTSAAAAPQAGDWRWLSFLDGTTAATVLEHVIVEYGGRGNRAAINDNDATITLRDVEVRDVLWDGFRALQSSPTLERVTVSQAGRYGVFLDASGTSQSPSLTDVEAISPANYGVYATGAVDATLQDSIIDNGVFFDSATAQPALTNVTIDNYDGFPLRIGADSPGDIIGLILNDTAVDSVIELIGETLSQDTVWGDFGIPYRVISGDVIVAGDSSSARFLTIAPAVAAQFHTTGRLQIGSGSNLGALVASGTDLAPIVLTRDPANVEWEGLYFADATDDELSILAQCIVEFGGRSLLANVRVDSSSPVIADCTIQNSTARGVWVRSGGAPEIRNNIVQDNTTQGIYIDTSGEPTIRNNDILRNAGGAITQASNNRVDARLNWFDDPTGPSGEGSGSGGAVSVNVVFDPWLEAAATTNFYIRDAFVRTRVFNPGSSETAIEGSFPMDGIWTVRVRCAEPAGCGTYSVDDVVRTIVGGAPPASTFDAVWDGTDDVGVALPVGDYRFELVASAGVDVAATARGSVTLDSTHPDGRISMPGYLESIVSGTIVDLTGWATDPAGNFTQYILEQGVGLFPTSYTTIVSSASPVSDGLLGQWDTTGEQDGLHALRLRVQRDNGGQVVENVVDLGVIVLAVDSLTLDEQAFSPNGDGVQDTVTATARLSADGEWTLRVVDVLTSEIVRSWSGSGTTIERTWDGTREDNGFVADDGDYRFELEAVRTNPGGGTTTVMEDSEVTVLDLVAPIASITTPTTEAFVYGNVEITGQAYDPDSRFVDYRIEYGVGSTPQSFVPVDALLDPASVPVPSGVLATWVTHDPACAGPNPIVNGGETLRLQVRDSAGNLAEDFRYVTLDNLELNNVGWVDPSVSSQDQVGELAFETNMVATATLNIYTELEAESGPLVRTLVQEFPNGSNVLAWDLRDEGGLVVADEAYVFSLDVDAGGGRVCQFRPSRSRPVGSGSGVIDPDYNPYTNDFWKMTYTQLAPGRVSMEVRTGTCMEPFGQFHVLQDRPYHETTFEVYWDGRHPGSGVIHDAACSQIYFDAPDVLSEHYIVVRGGTPRFESPEGMAPAPPLGATPYRVVASYGQVSRLRFVLDQQSRVTITVFDVRSNDPLEPTDPLYGLPGGPGVIVIDDELFSAGEHEVVFDPIDPMDPNESSVALFSTGVDAGQATFEIRATNPVTGNESVRLGILNLLR